MNPEDLITERSSVYGTIEANAGTTQNLMRIIHTYHNGAMSDVHEECVHMIFHKIARMVNGNPWHEDNARDIAGYATLLADHIREQNARSE